MKNNSDYRRKKSGKKAKKVKAADKAKAQRASITPAAKALKAAAQEEKRKAAETKKNAPLSLKEFKAKHSRCMPLEIYKDHAYIHVTREIFAYDLKGGTMHGWESYIANRVELAINNVKKYEHDLNRCKAARAAIAKYKITKHDQWARGNRPNYESLVNKALKITDGIPTEASMKIVNECLVLNYEWSGRTSPQSKKHYSRHVCAM